ncbi:META domain-containing protein [Mangrovimonas spongiae]|uniref:META domain-containing protein n=2 Tax=Mangrovimonas spongiae TaxID=2494697 RepID=A0A3R9PK03_9FLAO|nr:META domain-containing protein [Mangrovimonas spongiae]
MSSTCSSDDDDGVPNNNNIQDVSNIAMSGNWTVTSFIDSGIDETNHFNGYTFTFANNGTLTATNGSNTISGTWSVTNSNSNDDSSNDIDFNIFFPVDDNHPFEDLNDDWDITTYNSNLIDLIDISGGNGGTDTLTFEKS